MLKKYRPGVAIMMINRYNQVFLGKRKFTFRKYDNDLMNKLKEFGEEVWQMPQGGINNDESPIDCLNREALEEIGTNNFQVIAETEEWLSYDIPAEISKFCWDGSYIGQKQKWFLVSFKGHDSEININTKNPEFTNWQWVPYENILDLQIGFKKELYQAVIKKFEPYLPPSNKLLLSNFSFELPKELIAKYPAFPRDSSRLLYCTKEKLYEDLVFSQIIDLFRKDDLLILNNSKVIPAYFNGQIITGKNKGKKIVVYLNTELSSNKWSSFVKPAKFIDDGDLISLHGDLQAHAYKSKNNSGEVIFNFSKDIENLFEKICKYGKMPIPPYLKRIPDDSDFQNYQTCYASKYGSVAAPTAGLHFNQKTIESLKLKGVKVEYITLHVGSGTFLPIKTEAISDHKMHYEHFEISEKTAKSINDAKKNKNRIICVGTTCLRALESVATKMTKFDKIQSKTNIFIKPGFEFKIADVLITNFHTPKSTLLLLVSAFYGINNIKKIYQHAINNKYRFFSFGDACWLEKNSKNN